MLRWIAPRDAECAKISDGNSEAILQKLPQCPECPITENGMSTRSFPFFQSKSSSL